MPWRLSLVISFSWVIQLRCVKLTVWTVNTQLNDSFILCYLQCNYQDPLFLYVAFNSCVREQKMGVWRPSVHSRYHYVASVGSAVSTYNTDHYPTRADWWSHQSWGGLWGEKQGNNVQLRQTRGETVQETSSLSVCRLNNKARLYTRPRHTTTQIFVYQANFSND